VSLYNSLSASAVIPTAAELFEQFLPAAKVPGINRIDRMYLKSLPNLFEAFSFELHPEHLAAAILHLPNGFDESLAQLVALELLRRIGRTVLERRIFDRNSGIFASSCGLSP